MFVVWALSLNDCPSYCVYNYTIMYEVCINKDHAVTVMSLCMCVVLHMCLEGGREVASEITIMYPPTCIPIYMHPQLH